MQPQITIFGPQGSTYVRSARMILEEKGLAHRLVELPFPDYKGEEYLRERHPFGKVPSLQYGEFRLYETQAILRFIDDMHTEPRLQPSSPHQRARMNQIIGIVDAYAWPAMGAGILFNRIAKPMVGQEPDMMEIQAALPKAKVSLRAMAELIDFKAPYLCGDQLSLADLMVYPILNYLVDTPEGPLLAAELAPFRPWIDHMGQRQSARLLLAA